jgi:hypothetical protein
MGYEGPAPRLPVRRSHIHQLLKGVTHVVQLML